MIFHLRRIASMIAALCLCCALAAQGDTTSSPISNAKQLDLKALANPAPRELTTLKVHLADDGQLSGRLQLQYLTGKAQPAQASIAITRDGELIGTAQTDDAGEFQMTDIEPGQYLATAAVDRRSTNFQVEVLAYDPNASAEEMLMQGTLMPIPEGGVEGEMLVEGGIVEGVSMCGTCGGQIATEGVELIGDPCSCGEQIIEEEIIEEEIIEETCCSQMGGACCGGSGFGGGCCGGGGGVGGRGLGLLGLGGLAAGITALALNDGDPNVVVVSPSAP